VLQDRLSLASSEGQSFRCAAWAEHGLGGLAAWHYYPVGPEEGAMSKCQEYEVR